MGSVYPDFDGVRIEGAQYSVWIHPLTEWRGTGDATLSIGADAKVSPLGRLGAPDARHPDRLCRQRR